jgi:hypothetical protein
MPNDRVVGGGYIENPSEEVLVPVRISGSRPGVALEIKNKFLPTKDTLTPERCNLLTKGCGKE